MYLLLFEEARPGLDRFQPQTSFYGATKRSGFYQRGAPCVSGVAWNLRQVVLFDSGRRCFM